MSLFRIVVAPLLLSGAGIVALVFTTGWLVEFWLLPQRTAEQSRVFLFLELAASGGGLLGVVFFILPWRWRLHHTRGLHDLAIQRQTMQFAVNRILAGEGSPQDAMPQLLRAVCAGVSWNLGEFWHVDPAAGLLRYECSWHEQGLEIEGFEAVSRDSTFALGKGLPGIAWASGQPAWMNDVGRDDQFLRTRAAAKVGLKAAFAFPVCHGDTVTGVLAFFSRIAQSPDEELLQVMRDLGEQIGQYLERKRASHQLAVERNLLRTLMDNVPDGIYFKDEQCRFTRINRAVAQRFGLRDPAEAIGHCDADFFSEEFARQTRNDEQQVMRTGQPLADKEEKETWPDGRETWASTTTVPLRGSDGRIVGVCGISHDITERKRTEEALRRTETKYRSIFENAVEGIYQTSVDGRFVTANRMLARIYGFASTEELMAEVSRRQNHLYVQPGRRAEFMRQIRERSALTGFESEILRGDGSLVWISENARAIRSEAGKVVGYEGTVIDITERKQVEEALRTSNETLRALIEAAPLAILTLDSVGAIRSWNPAAERMFGWSRTEVLGRPTPLVPPDKQAEFRELFDRLMAGHAFAGVQARRQRKDGSPIDVSLSAAPLYDAAGQVCGIMALVADITDVKRAEQALDRERALLRSLIDSIPDHIFYKDRNGTYLGCNMAFEKYVGRDESEVIGRTAHDLFPRQVSAAYDDLDRRVLDEGRAQRSEDWLENADGRRVLVEVIKTPYYGPEGQILGLIGMARDISERKRLEEQLRQSQKMEAVGQLAGGIAHDFNNLLTAVLGNVGLLLSRDTASEPLREIERAAVRAADLTRQLLGFSRQTMLRLEPTNLHIAIAETVGMLRRTIDPRITVDVRAAGDGWWVEADPSQISQVLLNLCLNARDAMPQGGLLSLETANMVVDDQYARYRLGARAGEFVRLRVRDTGCGIPPEYRARIFDPFFTTKEPGKGTGLGLAMVFGIITQHRGWIECHSEVGRGTHFDVYLPRSARTGRPSFAEPESLPVGGNETVLLVDDEVIIRSLGQTILQQYGYRVILAEDGQAAVDIYRSERETIDLVILDLTMPRLSGGDALQQLLQLNPAVRVLLSSGYSAEQVACSDRVVGFVHKPYRPQDLAARVRQALDVERVS
jgi:PAS domain S-box-containing protein